MRRALEAIADDPAFTLVAASRTVSSHPVGPSQRRFANAAAIIATALDPEAVLEKLQSIEHRFGRRRQGMAWRSRTLDLDIVLWSGGPFASPRLIVPHPRFRERSFVTLPARSIAGDWHDPLTGRTVRQLHTRLTRARALP